MDKTFLISYWLSIDTDPKAIQQINYTGNLVRKGIVNTAMLIIIEEAS